VTVQRIDRTGGVGSIVEIPSWQLPSIELEIGGQTVELTEIDVYRESRPSLDRGRVQANLGRDLFDRFDEVIRDFRPLSFVLR
jgi:hypothetical protein